MFSRQTVLKYDLEFYSSCLFSKSFKITYQSACLAPFKLNVISQAIQTGKLNTSIKSIPKKIPPGEMRFIFMSLLPAILHIPRAILFDTVSILSECLGLLALHLNPTFIDVEL